MVIVTAFLVTGVLLWITVGVVVVSDPPNGSKWKS